MRLSTLSAPLAVLALVSAGLIASDSLRAPVEAASVAGQIPAIPCFDSNQCLELDNRGTGKGIVGTAVQNSGMVGATRKYSTVDPGDAAGFGGLVGMDLSTPPPSLQNPFSFTAGLFGFSKAGDGAIVVSNVQNGVVGLTFNPSTKNGGMFGVFGGDFSTDGGLLNEGVVGLSSGIGVEADGFAPLQSMGSPQLPALEVRCGGAPAIVAANGFADPTNDIMDLDCSGNLTVAGSIVSHAVPLAVTRTSSGANVVAFSPRQTQPTMEDVGESRLINGQAFVAFDPAFAATIDRRTNYLVFVTPEGDSRGLFVAQKAATGFVVRENQGGRSAVAFQYRIVAKPYDMNESRLPSLASIGQTQRAVILSQPHVQLRNIRPTLERRGIMTRP